MTRPLRAVLYARCSSLKQADRDLSVPAQLDACRLHAQRLGWLVSAEYHDDGISGFEDERRPAFRRMLADMLEQPRPFDVIVVWDFSRFSRSLEHSLKAMQDLRAAGVSLESTKEQTDDTPAGWLMGTIFRSFNEYQVRKLAEDTRRGMRKNAAEGGWNGGAVPVGYMVERPEIGRGPGKLVPDPAWAPLVQRIFSMALSGQGASGIVGTLNDEGLRTPRGRRWNKQTVLYMLRNEVYTGVYTWGTRSSAKFATDTAAPLRIEDAHEPLVSVEDFARVGAMIAQRRPTVTHPRTTNSDYLLSGLLVCGCCGASYIGHGARNNAYQYYSCQTKQKQGAKACPAARNFEQGKVEAVVLDALRDGALHPGVFGDLVHEVQASLRSKQAEAEGERAVLQGQLVELNRRLDNLYAAVEGGSIPAARLAPRIEEVSREKEALDGKIAALPEEGNEPLLQIDDADIAGWVADLRAVVERGTVDERRGLLRAWVRRVVADGDDLTIEYTFPLVSVAGPAGGAEGEPEPGSDSTTRTVNSRRRREPGVSGPETRKGETTLPRFLPTVVNGSPIRPWLENEPLRQWVVERDLPPSRSRRRQRTTGSQSADACHGNSPAVTGDSPRVPSGDDACHGCVPSAVVGRSRTRKRRGKGVQHLFERARRFRRMLDSGQAKSLRDLGQQEMISGARVCQILNVLDLAPEIIERVDIPLEELPPGINATRLREIAAAQDAAEQLRRFEAACSGW